MGIPRFFVWIRKKYPHILRDFSRREVIEKGVDNLYIDANGIFHPCAAQVFSLGKVTPLLSVNNRGKIPRNYIQEQLKLFAAICHEIEELIYIVRPRKRLVICIDGVAGSAKSVQQRERRFRSAQETSEHDFQLFNTAKISCGTQFMFFLSKYIDWWIRKKLTVQKEWQHLGNLFQQ